MANEPRDAPWTVNTFLGFLFPLFSWAKGKDDKIESLSELLLISRILAERLERYAEMNTEHRGLYEIECQNTTDKFFQVEKRFKKSVRDVLLLIDDMEVFVEALIELSPTLPVEMRAHLWDFIYSIKIMHDDTWDTLTRRVNEFEIVFKKVEPQLNEN